MLRSCFDLISCIRSAVGNGCILSRFFSFLSTSNKFHLMQVYLRIYRKFIVPLSRCAMKEDWSFTNLIRVCMRVCVTSINTSISYHYRILPLSQDKSSIFNFCHDEIVYTHHTYTRVCIIPISGCSTKPNCGFIILAMYSVNVFSPASCSVCMHLSVGVCRSAYACMQMYMRVCIYVRMHVCNMIRIT